MAGRLLFVILMYSFHEILVQALLPPKLTVNPPVITETETVTLDCQTASSVPVSGCFYTSSAGTVRRFSCLQTLTGTELLLLAHQSSPAEVKVKCFYIVKRGEKNDASPHSDESSITIQPPLPPKLTVNPPVITETDSVTLNCQTPSSVPVSWCFFYILSGGTVRRFSCLHKLTGTELLLLAHQSSPAEVKLTCFYIVKRGEKNDPSPHSVTSSITIRTPLPPKLTVNPPVITETDSVTLNCQTPSSVPVSWCFFYFLSRGTVRGFSCLHKLTGTELLLLAHQSSPAEVKLKCFYIVKRGEKNDPSPHSVTSSITIHNILDRESSMTPMMPTYSMNTGLTVSRPHASTLVTPVKRPSGWTVGTPSSTGSFISTFLTSVKSASETGTCMTPMNPGSGDEITGLITSTPGTKDSSNPATPLKTASETWIWKFVAVVAGCGVTVGLCILLVSAFLWNKRRTGPEEVNRRPESQNENLDTYHLYATISKEPAASALMGMEYNTVQLH